MTDKTPEQLAAEQAAAEESARAAAAAKGKTRKARVLVDGRHGKCNAIVELSADELKVAEEAGEVDSNKAAVAYAESLAAAAKAAG